MRISCNGCRVLRKGCNQDCTIRPCLQWIKSSDSQANATLFLAKFYGRAGLLNLIDSGPDHLRPAIFRSLLYEACGRIVNPVEGSVGLMWSGNWAQCQAAVDAVLNGLPIPQNTLSGASASHQIISPHKTYDIRHVSKDPTPGVVNSDTIHIGKPKTQTSRFKRLARSKNRTGESGRYGFVNSDAIMHGHAKYPVVTVEGSTTNPDLAFQTDTGEVGLELTLGFDG